MPLKIYENLDAAPLPGWKVLLYGDWGGGKSTLARKAPNSLYADLEGSRMAFRNTPLEGLPLMLPENMDELIEGVEQFARSDYETFIVDTISALRTDFITAKVMGLKSRNVASQAEYSEVNQRIHQLLSVCSKHSHKNYIFVCHMQLEKNSDGAVIQTRPSLGEATINAFGQKMDVVMYLRERTNSKGESTRALLTKTANVEGQGKVMSKDRLHLPPVVNNPDASLWVRLDQLHKGKEVTNNE